MFGRKTLEFMLICIGDEMRDSLIKNFGGIDKYEANEANRFTIVVLSK